MHHQGLAGERVGARGWRLVGNHPTGERLAAQGFDADGYMADWDSYVIAIEGSDASGAATISERLVQWNCAYQEALGIAECSATSNEPS